MSALRGTGLTRGAGESTLRWLVQRGTGACRTEKTSMVHSEEQRLNIKRYHNTQHTTIQCPEPSFTPFLWGVSK